MPALTPEQEALRQAALAAKNVKDLGHSWEVFEEIARPDTILALLAQLEAVQEAPSVPAQTGTVMLAGGGGSLKTAETRMDTGFLGGAEIADAGKLAALHQPVQAVPDRITADEIGQLAMELIGENREDDDEGFADGRACGIGHLHTAILTRIRQNESRAGAASGEPGQ